MRTFHSLTVSEKNKDKENHVVVGNVDPGPKYYNCTPATISVQKDSYKTLLKLECSHRVQIYLPSEVETPCVRW